MEEPTVSDMDHLQPDPLLKPGAFIDPSPNPSSNGTSKKKSPSSTTTTVDPPVVVESSQPSDQKDAAADGGVTSNGNNSSAASDKASESTDELSRPDWLPPDWIFFSRVRASGSSAGSRDKYYQDPVTNRRFRSKKEVMYFLETGTVRKRKNADSDADSTPSTNAKTVKRKKSETKAEKATKNFNFDAVPEKVKWSLTDAYEGTWRPLIDGADRVPESTKQEWSAAFRFLSLHNAGEAALQ